MWEPQILHDSVVAGAVYRSHFLVGEPLRLPAHPDTDFISEPYFVTHYLLLQFMPFWKQLNNIHYTKGKNTSFISIR
jgi:hypothetical protein